MSARSDKVARRRRRKAAQNRPRTTQRPRPTPDTGDLIAYGARCSWYDDKANAATLDGTPTGLPCCPHCRGVLFEIERHAWDLGVRERRAFESFADRDDYPDLVTWAHGRCFTTPIAMLAGWLEHLELRPVVADEMPCLATDPDGFICNRPRNHPDRHAAFGTDGGDPLARWPQETP